MYTNWRKYIQSIYNFYCLTIQNLIYSSFELWYTENINFQMPPGAQAKILELGGHKGTLCCDWSTANQSGTCITGGAEGKVRVSTLLSP